LTATTDLLEPTMSSSYKNQIQYTSENLNQFYQDYQELIQLLIKFNLQSRTIQNWKRRVKNSRTQSIILVHPSSRATSSLLFPSSKENFTNFNQLFTQTITQFLLLVRIKHPLNWAPTPRSPHSIQQSHTAKPIAYNNTQFHRFATNLHKSWYRKGSRSKEKLPD